MEFVNRFRAKNTKAAQAQSKLKQIERMDKVEAPEGDDRKLDFRFPQPQRSGHQGRSSWRTSTRPTARTWSIAA